MKDIDSSHLSVNNLTPQSSFTLPKNGDEVSRPVEKTEAQQKSKMTNSEQGEQERESLIAEVKNNLEKLNNFIPVTATNLSFEFDEANDPPFIRVVDKDNKEVIREIPSEEFREAAKALEEFADKLTNKGVLLDRTA